LPGQQVPALKLFSTKIGQKQEANGHFRMFETSIQAKILLLDKRVMHPVSMLRDLELYYSPFLDLGHPKEGSRTANLLHFYQPEYISPQHPPT
jgi:hypothetical protein